MTEVDLPGLTAAVVQGNQVIHVVALGEAQSGTPMSPETPMFLASLSKSLTALGIMTLVEGGLLDLDSSVALYLPELAPEAGGVTVRDLLHHHSGLSEYVGNEAWVGEGSESLQARVAALGPGFEPSAEFEYSNANYDVLARLAEVVAGDPFDTLMHERVFEPLGMSRSFAGPAGPRAHAQGHYHWLGLGFRPQSDVAPPGMMGSATMYSTAEDMARMVIAHLNDDPGVVSADSMEVLHDPGAYSLDIEGYPVAAGYAGGWNVDASFPPGEVDDELSALVTLWHDGSAIGHRNLIWLIPEAELGFVLLTNGSEATTEGWVGQVAQGVKFILFGLEPPPIDQGGPLPQRWGKHLLALIVVAQVLLGVSTVLMLRRNAGGEPMTRRHRFLMGLASTVDVAAGVLIFGVLPTVAEQPVRVTLVAPDMRILISAMTAGLVWGVVRTVWLARRLVGSSTARSET